VKLLARVTALIVAVACAAGLLSGCGYGLAGRTVSLPDHVKVIAVTMLNNRTAQPGLDQILTDAIRTELRGRGRWRIVPDANAPDVDAVVSGNVTGIVLSPIALNQGQATRVALTVSASVELKDVRNNKVIWSNTVVASDEYPIAPGTNTNDVAQFIRQNQDAYLRLSGKFGRTAVSAMLEGM
jgi:hypothetical protein